MKGDITLRVLERLADSVVTSTDLLEAFLSVGYGASYGRFHRELSKR